MERFKSLLSVRFAVLALLVVLLLGGVTFAVMDRGPSEAERAYALACEAILEQLPEDQRTSAVFPLLGSDGVHTSIGPDKTNRFIYAYVDLDTRRDWIAVVNKSQVSASFNRHGFTAPTDWR